MPDPTPYEEKAARISAIQKQQETLLQPMMQSRVGSVQRVLVEGRGRREGTCSGRTADNLTVEFEADTERIGSFAKVRIIGARLSVLDGVLEK